MATARRTRTTPNTAAVARARRAVRAGRETPVENVARMPQMPRMVIEYIDLNDITPYPFNPRDNEKAIPAVAKSIENFGFLVPCVIDQDNVLVAGHTRSEAAKLLGLTEVPCVRATHLTQEQINAFRLIDNKVAEQAAWDFDLLSGEITKLRDMGLDWTEFGWTQGDIDCLSEVVASDCLDASTMLPEAERASAEHSERRAPSTARYVLGELVFFIPATAYRSWIDGLRQLHDFNEDAMVADLKQRLGIME